MVSLFAFLIALGMIVDDAIIVTENIHHYIEEGMPVRQAALRGTREIVAPVIAATLTTVIAFSCRCLPSAARMGEFVKVIPGCSQCCAVGLFVGSLFCIAFACKFILKSANPSQKSLSRSCCGGDPLCYRQRATGEVLSTGKNYCSLINVICAGVLRNRYFVFVAASCVLILALIILTTAHPLSTIRTHRGRRVFRQHRSS